MANLGTDRLPRRPGDTMGLMLRADANACRAALALTVGLAAVSSAACAVRNRPDPVSTAVEVGTSARIASPRERLRVVTFNVAMQTAPAIYRAMQRSPALRDADIVFLQEVEARPGETTSRAGQVARRLGFFHAYAPGFGLEGGGSHGVAILSRYPLSNIHAMELPRRDMHYNSRRRVALGATVHVGRRAARLYSVHLDLRMRSRDRALQLAPVLRAASRHPEMPVIVAGDFNTTPFTWLGRVLPIPGGRHGTKLDSFARRHGFETPVASSGATSPWLGMRLDGIYTRRLEVAAFAVDRTVRISDHLPLWADVHLAGQ